ncbi:MAG: alpha-E domain-containing protein [Rhodospirillales bacterium]|nr:alpha-E domain-containing protein [Rhodospirillales bacterium]
MNSLLARFAENGFWMARYMERAENLARILDVNESFARDSDGEQDWLPIVQLHADDEAFFRRHAEATADAVIEFYILDRENPNSVVQTIWAARENARTLRHLISIELWSQLNVFYGSVSALRPRDLSLAQLSRLCQSIKEGCQLHTGIVEGTTFRDQSWLFYQLGKIIDRADQTTRLLDIKYHRLLPHVADVGTSIDVSQWNALLRSVAGYHGYRRVRPSGMSPESVAEFILLNAAFPRSVACCVERIRYYLDLIASNPDLAGVAFAADGLVDLEMQMSMSMKEVIGEGLHEYLDRAQINLQRLTNAIDRTFFNAQPAAPTSQSQYQ